MFNKRVNLGCVERAPVTEGSEPSGRRSPFEEHSVVQLHLSAHRGWQSQI